MNEVNDILLITLSKICNEKKMHDFTQESNKEQEPESCALVYTVGLTLLERPGDR